MSRDGFHSQGHVRVDGRDHEGVRPKRTDIEQWQSDHTGLDEETRRASKPLDVANAEFILGVMERFNYPNIQSVLDEDARLFQLLELETLGEKHFEKLRLEELEREQEALRAKYQ